MLVTISEMMRIQGEVREECIEWRAGRAQIHCDTEARSNMSNYALAAQWHQCCYLTRNSPAFSNAQSLAGETCSFQCHNAVLEAEY